MIGRGPKYGWRRAGTPRMCGIAGICGADWSPAQLAALVAYQAHRGPDGSGIYCTPDGRAGLGHNRLSIIDLSAAGDQPMCSADGRYWIVFNGEIYNYRELRAELADYPYRSRTDTEVILAAYQRWGAACLDRFIGMFALLLWDTQRGELFAARDRFGVKPLYYATQAGALLLASEPSALHRAGVPAQPDTAAWATYLTHGLLDHDSGTFWTGIHSLPAGHALHWQDGRLQTWQWYDLAARVGDREDDRLLAVVRDEYRDLLADSVRLRFRSDVPVGINLSGGLDSAILLGLVQAMQGSAATVRAFTFATGDPAYDELPWVRQMLAQTQHPSTVAWLTPDAVPALALSVQRHQAAPFGGLPTLAYARLFEEARAAGVIVLLDGQGMDEQWAGYDYYRAALTAAIGPVGVVQGTSEPPLRPACLRPAFRAEAGAFAPPQPFSDRLRNLQYRDLCYTKIPRALRFNDRVSMRAGTELREPFLDHRLVELALRQPTVRKIVGTTQKWLLRGIAADLLPQGVVEAPKRPLQTPQREWLRGPLRGWAADCITAALDSYGAWLDPAAVWPAWHAYVGGAGDNSFYIWQWINLGLAAQVAKETEATVV